MKKLREISKAFVALAVAALVMPVARAYDFESGGFYYNVLSGTQNVEITFQTEKGTAAYSGVIHIPAMVTFNGKSYSVTKIGSKAFEKSALTAIQIPNTITALGDSIFYFAENLADITLPQGITKIPDASFAGTAIADLAVPEGVTEIGVGAFQSCSRLHTVFLPSSLKKIDAYGFNNCHSLTEIYCAATAPVTATGWAIFIELTGIDLIVPSAAVDAYSATVPWNDAVTFTIYEQENVGVSMDVTGKPEGDWEALSLGNDLCFKIYDGDDLLATTAATTYYLPRLQSAKTYKIVPCNYFSDAAPIYYTVGGAAVDNASWQGDMQIYAHDGIIYLVGDNYGKRLRIYDGYGRMYVDRTAVGGEIEGLPRGQVYIVMCGNTVKKIML